MKTNTLPCIIYILYISTSVLAQTFSASESLNSFGINLLQATADEAGDSLNVALSPFTVWTLLSVIAEGARGSTLKQIDTALGLPMHDEKLRRSIQKLTRNISVKKESTVLEFNMALFHNSSVFVKQSYLDIIKNIYPVNVKAVDFSDILGAQQKINNYASKATRGRISKLVLADDIRDAHAFITSILYFKGLWGYPFNVSATRKEPFYDEKRNKIGEVDMMYQPGVFPFSRIDQIKAFAVELPYGHDRQMSMILILPLKDETISTVLRLISKQSMSVVYDELEKAEKEYVDEDVYVYIPRFKINSDLILNIVLNKMGIKDLFDQDRVDLLGMFEHYYPLSRFIQRAEIEVDETGTVASAAAGAAFPNKSYPPKFKANRPFLFFIVNKPTRSVLFSGKFSNPRSLQ